MKIPSLHENESTLLTVKSTPAQTADLFAALEAHGMRRVACEATSCGRAFLTRAPKITPELCPPCAGTVPVIRRVTV